MGEGVLVQITGITHRKNPILTLTTLGIPPDDSSIAASLTAGVAMKRGLKRRGVPVKEVYVPPAGVTHLIVVSVERGGSKVARQVLDFFTARRVMVSKVIVVDNDVDAFDMDQVMHAFATKCHPGQGITVEHYEGRANALTPCYDADERRKLNGASVVFDCDLARRLGRRTYSDEVGFRNHVSRCRKAKSSGELATRRFGRKVMSQEYVTFVRRLSQLSEGRQLLFIKDLTPGPRKYDTKLVRAELAKTASKLADGHTLWVRSETGYLYPQPWAIKILEELPPYVAGQPWQDVFAAMRQTK